jgi:hypothetical protein
MSLAGLVLVGCLALGFPAGALAALQPAIEGISVSYVNQHDAGLEARINPNGLSARGAVYQFQVVANPSEYLPEIACPEREHSLLGGGGCIGTPTHGFCRSARYRTARKAGGCTWASWPRAWG